MRWCSLMLCAALNGCASGPPLRLEEWPHGADSERVSLDKVPFYAQDLYQCGPAALAEALDFAGLHETPEQLAPDLYIPSREGTLQVEMLAETRRRGRLAYVIPASPSALVDELKAGHPVLVLQNQALSWFPSWHYAVVVGYQPDTGLVTLRSGAEREHELGFRTFEHTWARADHWGMLALVPGAVPASGDALRYADAVSALEKTAGTETATAAWQAGVQRWPDNLELGFGLGNNLYSRNDFSGAEHVFEKVLDMHPRSAEVYNNLAYVLAAQDRFPEAVQSAGQAVQLGGDNAPQFQDTLREMRCRAAGRPAGCTLEESSRPPP